jgi:hypothetical protein
MPLSARRADTRAEKRLRKAAANTRIEGGQWSIWREGKPALVSSSAGLRKWKEGAARDILKKGYALCLGSAERFKGCLLECALYNGHGRHVLPMYLPLIRQR